MSLNRYTSVLLFGILLVISTQINGQGITRSKGIGLRASLWKTKNHVMAIDVNTGNLESTGDVNVNGVGGGLLFFSRINDRFFFETSISSNASVEVNNIDLFEQETDVLTVIPFLIGLRYDIFPATMNTAFQPYGSFGFGPYWIFNTHVKDTSPMDSQVKIGSELEFGCTLGGGVFYMIRDWVALNLNIRHHWVNWDINNDFSGYEFSLGTCFMWGKKQEIFQVNDIKVLVQDIYPAYYQFYRTYPVALISIQNTAHYPIEVNVHAEMPGFSEREYQSGFKSIAKGKTADIPVNLILGRNILTSEENDVGVLDLKIEGRAGVTYSKTLSAQIVIHSKYAWNGDMDRLGYFVTPENPQVMAFSRSHSKKFKGTEPLKNFKTAQSIFDSLSQMDIFYHSDPNIPFYQDDRVQFAEYTLQEKTGDCDDLVVLFSSLLESIGIRTAFVDVKDPEKQIAHVYLLFDTGLAPQMGYMISSNDKKYILRQAGQKKSSIWIPIETTLITKGFDAAWKQGAMQYLEEGVIRNGLAEKWVQIVDIQNQDSFGTQSPRSNQ